MAIVAALHESHVQAAVICAKESGLQVRTRSGGHDYEGLSFSSSVPFVIIDLSNLRSIKIDMKTETAWVQAGATTGELYYRIAEKSKVHAFPAGVCTTLGIGGHFTGGGYGNMLRKFGLSIDNVVDAQLIDAKGRILNRKSMGEDVFWAIRGGGGTSFGIILSWKIKLVRVPPKVTVFQVAKTLEQGATVLVHKWLQVSHKLDKDIFIRIMPVTVAGTGNGNSTVRVSFIGHYLGRINRLLPLVNASFPELCLQRKDCTEMSWIESTLYWAGFPIGTSTDVLLNRVPNKVFFKTKSDYLKNVMPKAGLETLWKVMMEIGNMRMQMSPYGGRMAEISESETAFAHRAGTLYIVQYTAHWSEGSSEATKKYIDMKTETAWVQAGATTGELYYRIAEKSKVHAFPAGVCTTLGIGGHFTGGGYGNMLRKFGLSIDNVVDAQLIDAKGRILNRKSMGEDVFWAIRGGGGTSFGIILSWKIKLVRVPPKVTVFQVAKTLEQGATVLVHKWLQVSHKLDKDIFIRIMPVTVAGTGNGNSTVRVSFIGHYLGRINRLLPLVNASFPELCLQRKDCTEMSWIESTLYWAGFPIGTSTDVLLNRVPNKVFFKTKSDYLKNVMPKAGLETLWKVMMEIGNMRMQMSPYGGRMAEISESETAFAHRAGTLYIVQYTAHWSEGSSEATKKYVELMRKLYAEMAPYVSSKPREAFLNYRDLDIGSNNTDFEAAKVYGAKYFKGNFQRLAEVKAKIDPHNFFKNEQSIPPFPSF
ncbi:hypothetical protein GOBAR_AA26914 [Gossypium barbadense]|uniref:FAD-binding PCMH-type domain-containing protein n=1 Tax=Gossypium barbadense TaxID=3634 RepID=A0A2P5WRT1_GOSBA|nr:hypothetical protein GOBAR_AA26914 [Gossypium barbadense]